MKASHISLILLSAQGLSAAAIDPRAAVNAELVARGLVENLSLDVSHLLTRSGGTDSLAEFRAPKAPAPTRELLYLHAPTSLRYV
ncbi:predicted protein [Plenodomus lingam JN3]|uniref:Predicted protein n=1 Tax=Leptosphaeria maculans (strain JN3 / isolate v23.1.3 / race Av1-4-5-6-7-8) TaxID=985895 RepID=E4ZQC9_LEPMJ|nr:predicted protein [Plenodomus lingam JN3]CBX93604.1 predicted protein [Plenodomus lingam JN3]